MTIPRFSVLMSFYGGDTPEAFRESLRSLSRQTVRIDEIVLVQDGPVSDELQTILDEFADLPLVRVTLQERGGLTVALNAGLSRCRHDWVARMDSDDIADPERFRNQMDFLEEHPDIDVLGGQIDEFDDDPDICIGGRRVPLSHDGIAGFMRHRNPMNHMTVVFRRTVVTALGGYPSLSGMEDYLLWAQLFAAGRCFANMSQVLVRVRAAGLMGRRRGWTQVKSEWQLQQWLFRLGLVSFGTAVVNFILRAGMRLLPGMVLGRVYRIFLRKKR
jgi:cellulose synthase/poly-beta-1,6-N-acetylglucosamine synthase-like glycosyltransferase